MNAANARFRSARPQPKRVVALAATVLMIAACSSRGDDVQPPPGEPIPVGSQLQGAYELVLVDSIERPERVVTQGLEFGDSLLFESTGGYGSSTVRGMDPTTLEVQQERTLPSSHFAEGLTIVGDRVLQLTWREQTTWVWGKKHLDMVGKYEYQGEGWGLCFDGDVLHMSDGSAALLQRDPETFEVLGAVTVLRADGQPVGLLNELECIGGQVWANVFGEDWIAVIDPVSGELSASIDASRLRPAGVPQDLDHALNGIAYDSASDRLFVTGKQWPVMIEVDLFAADSA